MKHRITGRVGRDDYELVSHSGEVLKRIPLAEANSKLLKAIERNGWESL